MDALVTATQIPSAVSGLRALSRTGLRVVAVAPRRTAPGLWSRYAAARGLAPDPNDDPDGFVEAIGALAEHHGPLVIYPGDDEAVNLLVDARDRLPEQAILPYPGPEPLAAIRDKRSLAELATGTGLEAPRTLLTGLSEELAVGELPDGAVVKAAEPGQAFHHPTIAESAEELRAVLAAVPAGEELLIQERVAGPLMALVVVVGRDGALVRRFQQVATRTWPDAGPSSLASSVEPDEELAEGARSVLAAAGYWGMAHLQFIVTGDGPRVIDVNTRYYGSMTLALAAGVNLPAAWHAVAMDRPAGVPAPYGVGVNYRWLEADIIATLRGRRGLLLPRPPKPRTGPMWARDDPVPSAMFSVLSVTGALGRRLRGGSDG